MKKNLTNKALIVLAMFALIGFSMDASAFGKGQGYGCPGQGQAQGHGCSRQGQARGYGCQGQGAGCPGQGQGHGCQGKAACRGGLGEEEIKKLDALRQAFLEDTRDLRQELNAKELELGAELAKKNPDPEKAVGLQQELSGLEARFDQKRMNHILEMKKFSPNGGSGYAGKCKRGGGGWLVG